MRRVLLLAASTSLAAGVLFACEEDSNVGPPEFQFPDSGLLDTARPQPDARTLEDAPVEADARPTTVTITVTGRSGPVAGVRVVFHDATGAVLETKLTGADGKATSAGATPKMASALLSTDSRYEIMTWTNVEAGDDLQVRQLERNGLAAGSYAITFPGLYNGATRYSARVGNAGCEAPNLRPTVGPHDLQVYSGCVGAQNSVLVEAHGNTQTVAYAFKKNVAPPPVDGSSAVTVGNFVASTGQVVSATNIPPRREASPRLFEIANGTGFQNTSTTAFEAGAATYQLATGFADALQAEVYWSSDYAATSIIGRRLSGVIPPGAFAFDLASALPTITQLQIDDSGAHVKFSWASAAPLTAADGGLIRMPFYSDRDVQLAWSFVVPPGTDNITAPSMPAEASDWLPPSEGGVAWTRPEILFVESDLLADYAAFRRISGVFLSEDPIDREPILPQDGTFKLTGYRIMPR